jgi:two-component system, OmpR family, sensor histidine kinase ChvG
LQTRENNIKNLNPHMKKVAFVSSVRARFLLASLVLLLIPFVGFLFVRELAGFLRAGQEQVAVAATRLVAASISDRPEINIGLKKNTPPLDPTQVLTPQKSDAELERERIVMSFSASDPALVASLGNTYQPDGEVERILNQSGQRDQRVWVIDASGNVRGLAGALRNERIERTAAIKPSPRDWLRSWPAPITQKVMRYVLPPIKTIDIEADNIGEVMQQAQRAALGQSTVEWRNVGEKWTVMSVASPVWQQDNIVGAVIIEETDHQYRTLAKSAAESVMLMTLIVFVVVFGVLVGFAFRVASRLSRLQQAANRAIDAQGRVRGEIYATRDQDEIGALNETLRAMVSRQASYNSYLEQLAARLSHELRTPVAVVRSSLDNLRASPLSADDKIFLSRADEGVARLSQIISRMSEATQLERMLEGVKRERVNLVDLIGGCVAGYKQTFTHQRFTFTHDEDDMICQVVADTINQMLDKLVQNAIDFARGSPNEPIQISLNRQAKNIVIRVENKGPLLPQSDKDIAALFDSMVSKRSGENSESHLGLGLYIARLIAEFHGGTITAANLDDGSGVKFCVTLPF